jgi:hypothetical protein
VPTLSESGKRGETQILLAEQGIITASCALNQQVRAAKQPFKALSPNNVRINIA